jgi:hypothetical protein
MKKHRFMCVLSEDLEGKQFLPAYVSLYGQKDK